MASTSPSTSARLARSSGGTKLPLTSTRCTSFIGRLKGSTIAQIVEPSGKVTRIVAGESFILPKGLVRQWRQAGDVKKIFVILETPDDAAKRDRFSP